MNMSEASAIEWRILNEEAQIASKGGKIVAIAYTARASSSDGSQWLEFCWAPVDDPGLVDLHFGVAAGAGSA